jgi:hypothetical protein
VCGGGVRDMISTSPWKCPPLNLWNFSISWKWKEKK